MGDCCCNAAPQVNLCTCDPEADPAACNSLSVTPDGALLVPSTNLVPFPPIAPNPVGGSRSVDIVLGHPGGCPDTWQLGARLSPVFGAATQGNQAIGPNVGAFVNTPLQLTLPQPGRYLVTFDVTGRLCGRAAASSINRWMQARAVNVQTGGIVINHRFLTQLQYSLDPGTAFQSCNLGTASLTAIVTVPAAQTIRVQVGAFGSGGTAVTATRLLSYGTFVKVSD